MNRFRSLLALCVVVSLTAIAKAQTPIAPADDEQIHAALKGMDDAWNQHDMKAYVSYMTDDVEWVNVVGMWWRGKDQVFRAHDAYHQTIFKTRQIHPPQTVALRLLGPGVVLATTIGVVDGFTSPTGRVEPAGRDVLTEVFVKRGGRWLVAEGHNTTVVEAAQKSDPIQP